MMKLSPKITSGVIAVGAYLGILGLIFYYFGYRTHSKPKHYVAKNDKAIAVSLQTPHALPAAKKAPPMPKSKPKTPPRKPRHVKPKPIATSQPAKPTPKPKPKKTVKKIKPKKIKPKSLFSHVKTTPKPKPQSTKRPKPTPKTSPKTSKNAKPSREALRKQQQRDKGIENRYLANVQNKLYGWPPQSNFAGAKITIGLTIHPNGRFEYVVLTPSSNPDFDRTIRQYLTQLKSIGFGATPKGKKYSFKVDIVAK